MKINESIQTVADLINRKQIRKAAYFSFVHKVEVQKQQIFPGTNLQYFSGVNLFLFVYLICFTI